MKVSMKTRGALVGSSVLLAALSSACCWLPLLAVALGFSAVRVGSIFEAYRWPLVALAVGLVVVGAVFQRRRACAQDGCPPPRRSGLLTPLLGGVFVVLFAVIPEGLAWIAPDAATRRANHASSTLTRAYSVTGMTCEGCTSLLDSSLEDQPEVESATVTYAEARVQVEFVAGTTAAEADQVMERVSADWEGKYAFSEASVL